MLRRINEDKDSPPPLTASSNLLMEEFDTDSSRAALNIRRSCEQGKNRESPVRCAGNQVSSSICIDDRYEITKQPSEDSELIPAT